MALVDKNILFYVARRLRWAAFLCAGHGTNSVGDKPTTGIYHQV